MANANTLEGLVFLSRELVGTRHLFNDVMDTGLIHSSRKHSAFYALDELVKAVNQEIGRIVAHSDAEGE